MHAFGDAAHCFGSQYGMTEVGKSQYGAQCTFDAGEVIGGEIAGLISHAALRQFFLADDVCQVNTSLLRRNVYMNSAGS